MSKEGIFNWAFTLASLATLAVFIFMSVESASILAARNSSEDYKYYYNDFSAYISYYMAYKLMKSISICIILARFAFLIGKTERGRVYFVAIETVTLTLLDR